MEKPEFELARLDDLSLLVGLAFSSAARLTGEPGLIAIPLVTDLFYGGNLNPLNYLKYFAGAAIPYADIIYIAMADKL